MSSNSLAVPYGFIAITSLSKHRRNTFGVERIKYRIARIMVTEFSYFQFNYRVSFENGFGFSCNKFELLKSAIAMADFCSEIPELSMVIPAYSRDRVREIRALVVAKAAQLEPWNYA